MGSGGNKYACRAPHSAHREAARERTHAGRFERLLQKLLGGHTTSNDVGSLAWGRLQSPVLNTYRLMSHTWSRDQPHPHIMARQKSPPSDALRPYLLQVAVLQQQLGGLISCEVVVFTGIAQLLTQLQQQQQPVKQAVDRKSAVNKVWKVGQVQSCRVGCVCTETAGRGWAAHAKKKFSVRALRCRALAQLNVRFDSHCWGKAPNRHTTGPNLLSTRPAPLLLPCATHQLSLALVSCL